TPTSPAHGWLAAALMVAPLKVQEAQLAASHWVAVPTVRPGSLMNTVCADGTVTDEPLSGLLLPSPCSACRMVEPTDQTQGWSLASRVTSTERLSYGARTDTSVGPRL